jgi:hypothetical protein
MISGITTRATVSKNCLTCPAFLNGRCKGSTLQAAARPMTTEAAQRAPVNRHNKKEGDISSVFTTFSGRKAEPLPPRFKDLKHRLVAGFEEDIQKSWDDLVEELKGRTEEVATQREKVSAYVARPPLSRLLLTTPELFRQIIPIVQFKDIVAGTVPKETR